MPDDVEKCSEAMRVLAAEPVDDAAPPEEDGDGILAQYGTYERFQLDITRQLTFYDDDGDEYQGMTQLHCTFYYEPSEELTAVGEESLWSFGMKLDEFFAKAAALPGFVTVARLRAHPLQLDIGYGEV
jgi:hypothetical protein